MNLSEAEMSPAGLRSGATPLLPSRRLPGLWWKDEGQNPTGSVAARSATIAVASARAAGAQAVCYRGSSDECAAVVAYAAAAGLGTQLELDGPLSMADRLWCELGSKPPSEATHVVDLDPNVWASGLESLALEIVEQLGRRPSTVVWVGATPAQSAAVRKGFERAASPSCSAPALVSSTNATEGWPEALRSVLASDSILLSRAGALGAVAAQAMRSRAGDIVVINPRSALKEAEELARWLGVRVLPGRVPVGGIITPL